MDSHMKGTGMFVFSLKGKGCKLRFLVSLRVLRTERLHFKPSRSCLGLHVKMSLLGLTKSLSHAQIGLLKVAGDTYA